MPGMRGCQACLAGWVGAGHRGAESVSTHLGRGLLLWGPSLLARNWGVRRSWGPKPEHPNTHLGQVVESTAPGRGAPPHAHAPWLGPGGFRRRGRGALHTHPWLAPATSTRSHMVSVGLVGGAWWWPTSIPILKSQRVCFVRYKVHQRWPSSSQIEAHQPRRTCDLCQKTRGQSHGTPRPRLFGTCSYHKGPAAGTPRF